MLRGGGCVASVVLLLIAGGCSSTPPKTPEGGAGKKEPAAPAEAKEPKEPKQEAPGAPMPAPARSLYERLGGEAAISAVVDDFLGRCVADPAIKGRFIGANVPGLRRGLIALIGQASGGPQVYKGLDMKTAHAGMGVTDAEFDALVADLVASLDKLKVGAKEKDELLGALGPMRKDVVERKPSIDDRLARMEAILARIEARLAAIERGAGSGASAPRPVAAPPGAARPAKAPVKARTWSADEKELSKKLVTRYAREGSKEGGEQRGDVVGKKLETTQFFLSNGEVVDLRSFEGKKRVVLVILRGFAGSVCLHCSTQTLALADNADKFKARNAEVILVYPGEAESVPAFLDAVKNLRDGFAPPFPIALDVDLTFVKTFLIEGSLAKPTSLVIDEKGIVRYAYVGKQPQDRPSAEDLLGVLDKLPKASQ